MIIHEELTTANSCMAVLIAVYRYHICIRPYSPLQEYLSHRITLNLQQAFINMQIMHVFKIICFKFSFMHDHL